MRTMKYKSTVQDKLSIPEDFKVEREVRKVAVKIHFTATFSEGFKPGESLDLDS